VKPQPDASPRGRFLAELRRELLRPGPDGRATLVAVDGVDGAGKTVLADELARLLDETIATVRISIDGFHHTRVRRYARGRDSAEGFWLDSYDYGAFRREVVDPFRRGTGTYLPAIHDVDSDETLIGPRHPVIPGALVIVDGIFLHRDEIHDVWDASIFLDVPFVESVRRLAVRDGSSSDPASAENVRYVEGQRLYLQSCDPWSRASILVDYADLEAPRVIPSGSIAGPGRIDGAPTARSRERNR